MLAKKYRLRKNKDFEKAAKKGQAVFGNALSLKWIKNDLYYARFGIVVSLKVDKRATVRNRIKRIIRAIIRGHFNQFKQGFDYLVLANHDIKSMDYNEIKDKLLDLFKKGHLIIDDKKTEISCMENRKY